MTVTRNSTSQLAGRPLRAGQGLDRGLRAKVTLSWSVISSTRPSTSQPAAVLNFPGGVPCALAGARIDGQELLVGVVEHAHDEKAGAIRRPAPEGAATAGARWRSEPVRSASRVHLGRPRALLPNATRRPSGDAAFPREEPLPLPAGSTDTGATGPGRDARRDGSSVAPRSPPRAAAMGSSKDCERRVGHRDARCAFLRSRERPRLIDARALVGHDGEGATVRRERKSRAARESARRVRDAREPVARMEVRERPVWHSGLPYR